jgi:hypothetical protein
MLKDNLEKFILENRAAFDTAVPPARVWAAIETQLIEKKSAPSANFFPKTIALKYAASIAAMVLLLLGAGAWGGAYYTQRAYDVALQQVAPDFKETERFYQSEIRQRTKILAKYSIDKSVQNDLAQLDAIVEDLKRELRNSPKSSREQIVHSLLESYQAKVNVLEQILARVEPNQPPSPSTKISIKHVSDM